MYMRILKKDLKRKKTMNTILLLFVILATMFAASSVNNIITVINGLDNYFEKANMSDQLVLNLNNNGDELEEVISKKSGVKDFRREDLLQFNDNCLTQNEKKLAEISRVLFALSIDNAKINYFNKDNEVIREVKEGSAYLAGSIIKKADLDIGEKFNLKIGDTELTLTYAGIAKDAFLGSDMMGNTRVILNDNDYEKFTADPKAAKGHIAQAFYINGYDKKELASELSDLQNVTLNMDVDTIKTAYIMNSIIAGLLLIVGICLILISFVVLSFTIKFTLNEEFREIGVMKALGLKNNSVRGLYLIKYLGIAVIGAVIGFALSIPFGDMLLSSVSDNMVLESENSIFIGILCSIAVVLVILLFCWGCTGKIKKLSPIDAVRCGQNGERFRKKSIMSLGKSKLGATGFLAANDVMSAPKQYTIITLVFTLCLLLIMVLANTANTLASEKLLPLFCTKKSDAYITDTGIISKMLTDEMTLTELNEDIEKKITENGMPCKVTSEAMITPMVEANGNTSSAVFMYNKDTKASDYTYTEGYAPKYANEIALTGSVAEKLGIGIGDKVNITLGGKTEEYVVSAFFQSMMQLGETGRFSEEADIPDEFVTQVVGFQVDFNDSPDEAEIADRIERIKDIFDTKYVDDTDGFVLSCIGSDIRGTLNSVKYLVIAITTIIVIMISVLMERSFISKEKSEIALMKAMGFRSHSIISQHTVRFTITAIISSIAAALLCLPLTKLTIDPIFGIMGAVNGVDYNFRFTEICVVYPILVIAATLLGAFFTAQYMKTIKASDTADIE